MAFEKMVNNEELPYGYIIAGSVEEAHTILDSEHFDIVITDYLLGDGTAFDILDSVKNTPIILVTGAGGEEIAVTAWKAGIYDYLIKDDERNYLKILPITVENAIKHKRAESQLRLLSHAIMSTDDSVYIADMNDEVIFVNRAFCETYGYTKEEVIGKNIDILWADGHQNTENVETTVYQRRKDGSEFPVSLTRSDVQDENGNKVALVVIARDISEHILTESLVRTLNKLKTGNRRMN